MATFDFIGLQNTLKSMGFYDFVLPWLLAFSIVFGILQTVMIFKKGTGTHGERIRKEIGKPENEQNEYRQTRTFCSSHHCKGRDDAIVTAVDDVLNVRTQLVAVDFLPAVLG